MKYSRWLVSLLLSLGMWSCHKEKVIQLSFFSWGFSLEGFPLSKTHLEKLEQETNIAAQIIQFYLQWPIDHFDSITSTLNAITDVGAIPCITWEPMSMIENSEKTIPYEHILNGQYDAYLNKMADEIKTWKKPLIIRLAHEMNLQRYHWGTTEKEFGSQSPAIYIKIFRYVVAFFKNQKVHNVFWAFCPNVDSIPSQPWNKATSYYPGDEYVDILGMDGYNWAITPEIATNRHITWTKPWLSFEQLFSNLYQELKTLAPDKPIIVFETATVDRDGFKRHAWLKDALKTAEMWKLMAIIWFQAKKEEDWRIQQNEDHSYIPLIRAATSPINTWLSVKTK